MTTRDQKINLAIVIPAYKTFYLGQALESIAAQTSKNFKVYIADDGSSEDIAVIAKAFSARIPLSYHRFSDNLGSKSLTGHWGRSVALSNEEWVWLFSDDDIMAPDCAAVFLEALEQTCAAYNLYRFNIEMIDSCGKTICVKEQHPIWESAYNFMQRRLQGKSLSAAVEYIFRRDNFESSGGFIDFPLAVCSDDASWINLAGDKGIYTFEKGRVFWRSSQINISSRKGLHVKKIDAMLQYSIWLKKRFSELPVKTIEAWFFENLRYICGRPSWNERYHLAQRLSAVFQGTTITYLKKLFIDGLF